MAAFDTQFRLERGQTQASMLPTAIITVATGGYFDTLHVGLHSGRPFASTDRLDTPPVAIVNRAFAARSCRGWTQWVSGLTIGSSDKTGPWTTIVGVADDVRNAGAALAVRPEIFVPMHQQYAGISSSCSFAPTLTRRRLSRPSGSAVVSLDPEQPIYTVQTLEEAMALSAFQQRLSAILLGIFAAIALALAAIGIYGVMAYAVTARTREIGVRLAVGAQRREVIWLVLGQVLTLSCLGLALGIGGLFLAGRGLRGLLVGVSPNDPMTIGLAATGLGIVALLAGWSPAWRASRVDPIQALRSE